MIKFHVISIILYVCICRGDLAHNGSIDLNELTERPVCGTMTNSKPTTEVSNENMYADWASVDKKASKNPTEKNS